MADKVQISSIRVTAEMDASKFKQGTDQVTAGIKQVGAAGTEIAATLTTAQQKVNQSGDVFDRLSRKYIDGHAAAMTFRSELNRLVSGVERGTGTVAQALPILEGMYKRFGQLGDSASIAARGQTELAAAVERANEELRQQQQISANSAATAEQAKRIDELRMRFDSAYASSRKLGEELRDLAEAERIGAVTAAQAVAQQDALARKYDETAAAAHRAREEHATFLASQNQQRFNQFVGVTEAPRPGSVASGSAAVFEAEFARLEDITRQKAMQAGAVFAVEFGESLRSNLSGKVASQSAAVFQAEFDRLDEIARLQAQQTGAAFGQWLGDSLKANLSGKVASQSAAVFQAEFDRLDEIVRLQAQQTGAAFGQWLGDSLKANLSGKVASQSAAVFQAEFDRLDEIARLQAQQTGAAFGQWLSDSLKANLSGKVASQSAAIFQAEFDRLDEIARQKAAQIGQQFGQELADSIKSNLSGKIASQSAAVFQAEFDRLDEIARQRAAQIGQNFQSDLNASFGIGGGAAPKSARASAGVFEEAARETEMYAQQAAELRAALDPAAAAQERLNAEIAQYNVLLARGDILQDEFVRGQALAQQRHIGSQEGQGGLSRFGAMNAAAQFQDIAITAQMGQSIPTIMLQQGTQLGQALEAGMKPGAGLKGMLQGLGGALTSLISPANLMGMAIAGAMAVGVKLVGMLIPEVEALDKVVERHTKNVDRVAQSYKDATNAAMTYADTRESQTTLFLETEREAEALQKRLQTEAQSVYQETALPFKGLGSSILPDLTQILPKGLTSAAAQLGPIFDPLMKLNDAAKTGTPNFREFRLEMSLIAQDDSFPQAIRERAFELSNMTKEFDAAQRALNMFETRDEKWVRGRMAARDMTALSAFDIADQAAQNRMRTQSQAGLLNLTARSPAELAAAARRQAEVANVTDASAGQRRTRIEIAETEALTAATQALIDAQEDRDRSQQRSLTTAQNNIDLVGKTVAETEGLRLAYERESEMRDEAERGHRAADEAAIARARERAMAEGQLIAVLQARQEIVGQEKQLETLRRETQLVGTNSAAHDAAIRTLETEQKIRELGIAISEAEASQMRINTTLINQEIAARQRLQLMDDLAFASAQRGRGATEAAIRERLRAADQPDNIDSPAGQAIRRDLAEERRLQLDAEDRARRMSIDASRQEIGLVGRTTTEVARLRYEYEELARIREEAKQRNEPVDPAREDQARREAREVGDIAARQAAAESIQSQEDQIELQRAEIATIGQGTLAREAAINTLKTEIEIRKLGTGATEEQTAALRANTAELNALAEASAKAQLAQDLLFEARQAGRSTEDQGIATELRARGFDDSNLNSPEAQAVRQIEQIKRLKDTWQELFDTVDDGIDSMVDTLFDGTGDWEEQLKKIGRQFARQMFDLALTNPLKNFLTGGNNNTIADLGIFGSGASSGRGGGFGGALGSLFGAQKAVASMQVQATTVIVNGNLLGGAGANGIVGGAANDNFGITPGNAASQGLNPENFRPGGRSGPGTPNEGSILSFLTGRGLTQDQAAGVIGNLSAESGLNPNAVNPSSGAFGLAQWLGPRKTALFAKYGPNPTQGQQMEFLWSELQGPEKATLNRLTASTDVRGSTRAFAGYERAEGYTPQNPEGIALWQRRLNEAQRVAGRGGAVEVAGAGGASELSGGAGVDTLTTGSITGKGDRLTGKGDRLTSDPFGGRYEDEMASSRVDIAHGDATAELRGNIGLTSDELARLTDTTKVASESLEKAGLAGMDAVKGLTDATGGLTQFGSLLSSFMAPGGGSGSGWFQNLTSIFGSAAGAIGSMQSISPGATSAILAGGGLGPKGLYASGGFTGDGDTTEPAGVVHRGEFVFSKAATAKLGIKNLDKMHRAAARGSYANGGAAGLGTGGIYGPDVTTMDYEQQRFILTDLSASADKAATSLDNVGDSGDDASSGLGDIAAMAGGAIGIVSMLAGAGGGGKGGAGGMLGGIGNFFGSLFGGGGGAGLGAMNAISPAAAFSVSSGIGGGLYHEGGIAGLPTSYRGVDARMFIGARRYHNGGLAGDEVPAILRRGEPVFRSMDDARRMTQPANQNIDQLAAAVGKKLNINLKNINVYDPSVVGDYTRTDPGEQAMINMMRRTGTGRGL